MIEIVQAFKGSDGNLYKTKEEAISGGHLGALVSIEYKLLSKYRYGIPWAKSILENWEAIKRIME